jgi:hypothetical protein
MKSDSPEYLALHALSKKNTSTNRIDTPKDAGKVRGWLLAHLDELPLWIVDDPLLIELLFQRQIELPTRHGFWYKIFSEKVVFYNESSEERSEFMELPLEIREFIYEDAMNDLPHDFEPPVWPDGDFWLSRLPPISFASRQILWESTLVYLRRTNFTLQGHSTDDQKSFLQYLCQFPTREGFDAVRSLEYNLLQHSHLPSLMVFRGLHRLIVDFYPDSQFTERVQKTSSEITNNSAQFTSCLP